MNEKKHHIVDFIQDAQVTAGINIPEYELQRLLNSLPAPRIARLLESSPPDQRAILWQLVEEIHQGDVLQAMSDEVQISILDDLNAENVAQIIVSLADDDAADILQQLPHTLMEEVLHAMSEQDRKRTEAVLSYEPDTAGGLMNPQTVTVRPRHTLYVVLRYLRALPLFPIETDSIFVVSRDNVLLGRLPLASIVSNSPELTVREIMQHDITMLSDDLEANEVAAQFEIHDWISAPVVDAEGHLLGKVTIDDVVDVIRETADQSLLAMTGGITEDTFTSTFKAFRARAFWLSINLVTALSASAVIQIFEGTLEKVVALAILLPLVASMGGVAGTQTLTILVRGIALNQITRHNALWIMRRELKLGLGNGLLWALVIAIIVSLWFMDPNIGIIIALATVINFIGAALFGVSIPLIMRRFNIDPALAGTVVITTITDIIGFFSFLYLASLFYA